MNEFKENIISKIQKGEISQKSRMYFLTRTYALYLVSGVSLALGMFAISGLFHAISKEQITNLRGIDWSYTDLPILAQALPFVWIVSVFILLLVSWIHISHTKNSYRVRPLVMVFCVFLVSIIGGYVLFTHGAGERLENKIRKEVPRYEQRAQNRMDGVDRVRDKYKKPKPEEILRRINQRATEGKNYVALPKECRLIKYTCEENQTPFQDKRGCGCQR